MSIRRNVVRHSHQTASRQGPARRRRRTPWLDRLEDRMLLSTVTWTNPAGGDWDIAPNWSTDSVPGPADDVIIEVHPDLAHAGIILTQVHV